MGNTARRYDVNRYGQTVGGRRRTTTDRGYSQDEDYDISDPRNSINLWGNTHGPSPITFDPEEAAEQRRNTMNQRKMQTTRGNTSIRRQSPAQQYPVLYEDDGVPQRQYRQPTGPQSRRGPRAYRVVTVSGVFMFLSAVMLFLLYAVIGLVAQGADTYNGYRYGMLAHVTEYKAVLGLKDKRGQVDDENHQSLIMAVNNNGSDLVIIFVRGNNDSPLELTGPTNYSQGSSSDVPKLYFRSQPGSIYPSIILQAWGGYFLYANENGSFHPYVPMQQY